MVRHCNDDLFGDGTGRRHESGGQPCRASRCEIHLLLFLDLYAGCQAICPDSLQEPPSLPVIRG